ncbi:MAG: signal peptidase I [Alphaproteobacteria bacterium]|nr:signal peptidase I [Alphaproteobacteria bacterium]
MKKEKKGFFSGTMGLVWAALIALGIRSFFLEPYNIPSSSMVPTLLIGDYLFISKWDYGYSRHAFPFSIPLIPGRIFADAPQRGDVVVFKTPTDNRTDFIKRVIGLPGDAIQVKAGRLHINGAIVPRAFKAKEFWTTEGGSAVYTRYVETLPNGLEHDIYEVSDTIAIVDDTPEIIVPPDHFFVMGDNRDNSQDSRFWGPVPAGNLVGKARFIFYSNNGAGWFVEFWKWHKSLRFSRFFNGIH